jgi:hypothetical protein
MTHPPEGADRSAWTARDRLIGSPNRCEGHLRNTRPEGWGALMKRLKVL